MYCWYFNYNDLIIAKIVLQSKDKRKNGLFLKSGPKFSPKKS